MPTRRVMKSVLHNFLGTYTSRYSGYRGYWLHGQLPTVAQFEFNLLGVVSDTDAPIEVARRLAKRRFSEQLEKSGLNPSRVREATLRIDRIDGVVQGWQGRSMSDGQLVRFSARTVMDNERVYQDEQTVFVAPHDPLKEYQSVETSSDSS